MISGISSSGGYSPLPRISKDKTATPPAPGKASPEVSADAGDAELRVPQGDHKSLTREFNLFDLAQRQFERILPRLEMATVPVE